MWSLRLYVPGYGYRGRARVFEMKPLAVSTCFTYLGTGVDALDHFHSSSTRNSDVVHHVDHRGLRIEEVAASDG